MASSSAPKVVDQTELLASWSRPSLADLDDDDSIIRWVAAFTGDGDFVDDIEKFTTENAHEFKDMEEGSFSLKHTDLYHQFLELTESKIAAFLETKGWTPEKFYKECREAVEQSEKSRRYSPDSFFINTLLACSEFDQFVMMMTRVQESLREAKTGLKQACEAVLKVLDDDNEVSKDQVDEIRTRCRTTLEWLDEHPDATMPELLDVQTAHDLKLIEVFGDAESDDKAAIGRLRRAAFES